ncbi:polysaccharide deacetylase family protein [Clostridium thailandense]|uniref:polysaccharide deacetylase family protein n=1 Tax=Clostridium thailandense TaxID=2794346 RepID=UPI003988A7F2
MQDIIRRRNIKRRKNKIRKRRIRTSMFIIACIACAAVSIKMIYKSKNSNNIKNNNAVTSSVDKSKENQVNVAGTKNEAESNSVKQATSSNSTQDKAEVKGEVNNQGVNVEQALVEDGKKTAYLTFDDGPSVTVTPKILDTLKQYKINGTFFVLGSNIEQGEESKEVLKRTFEEGNSIGNHSYTHNLKKLYPHNRVNVDYFMEELDKTNKSLQNVLGQDFNTRIIRMPGGYMSRQYYKDPNLSAFNAKLKEKNMCYIDWNAYDFDSEGKWKNSEQLLEEVKSSVGDKQKVVILMHDTYGKEETAKALPKIIEYLKNQGYEFKTLK